MRIVGIAGSLLPGAYVWRLLEAAARELPATVDFEIWSGLEQVPPFEDGELPRPVSDLWHRLSAADGVLIAAPAHSTLPAQLGHTLDWVASARGGAVLVGKPVGVVTACPRAHEAMWTQIQLGRALGAAGAVVHGAELLISPSGPPPEPFDTEGRLTDRDHRERLRRMLDEVCSQARSASRPSLSGSPG
ncbi:NAD(P)H-dependent oxidoreductase [Streptosporangium longisporum]|uniref:NADPH-dependent FMN reductase-like domain-containing protein n=1 Tax=Streptosporangium longisporum TaxID=46187 RepID=A0ABP6LJ08_9ACTN